MTSYAVGDIQGCLQPLLCLLDDVNFTPEKDRLWIAGDLVNRGPQSLETLRFLKSLGSSTSIILGNHDLHLMAIARGHQYPRPKDTLDDILDAPDCYELIDWLRQQKIMHYDDVLGYAMVHAGIPPQWGLKKALRRAGEVETMLRSDNIDDFLQDMYGNLPDQWHKELSGTERLRVITNYFTRMRFCSKDGVLELKSKSGIDTAPTGFKPWFAHEHRKMAQHKIIFGHWAALEGKVDTPNVFALDTGCVWGGTLTMMRLEDGKRFNCQC